MNVAAIERKTAAVHAVTTIQSDMLIEIDTSESG